MICHKKQQTPIFDLFPTTIYLIKLIIKAVSATPKTQPEPTLENKVVCLMHWAWFFLIVIWYIVFKAANLITNVVIWCNNLDDSNVHAICLLWSWLLTLIMGGTCQRHNFALGARGVFLICALSHIKHKVNAFYKGLNN